MKKLLILALLLTQIGIAQEKRTQKVGDFNEVRVFRGLSTELIESNTPRVEIIGDKKGEVIIKNVNGVLKISLNILETFSADEVQVKIYYENNIDLIEANEGSYITSDEKFKQEKIEIIAEEGGRIELAVNTTYLEVKAVTAGNVELIGKSENQNVTVNTGGIYKGSELSTSYTKVSASTGGIASVHGTKLIDANANLGATISLSGDADEVKKKESLGGSIRD